MTNNWLNIYHEYSQDLDRHEVLLVGEKDGKQFSEAFTVPVDMPGQNFKMFIEFLNKALEKYSAIGVDATPKE